MVITMASYAVQTSPRVAHAKPPGPKFKARNYKPEDYTASVKSRCVKLFSKTQFSLAGLQLCAGGDRLTDRLGNR